MVLSSTQLKHLRDYDYFVVNKSIVEARMQWFWNWLIEQVPRWWSCNAITVVGLVLNIVTTLLLVFYSPDGKQPVPGWAYVLCAVGLWVYQTLDNIDGKQARRTDTDGPVEDMFDHGCDSLSQVAIVLGSCIAMRLGEEPNWMMFSACFGSVLFYCSQWQWYVTGTFQTYHIDVTEGHYAIIGMYLTSAVYGDAVWSLTDPVFGIKLKMFALAFCVLCGAVHMMNNFIFIFVTGTKRKDGLSIFGTRSTFPMFPMFAVIALQVMLPVILPHQIYIHSPCLYVIAFGLLATKVTLRVMVAYMTKSEMDLFCSGFIGPAFLIINYYVINIFSQQVALWLCFIALTVDVCRYSTQIAAEFCKQLTMNCFSKNPNCTYPTPSQREKLRAGQ